MGLSGIGWGEILLIFVIAIIVLGPRRLPEMARSLGRFIRNVRRMGSDLTAAVSRELDETKEDLTPADSKAKEAEAATPPERHPKTGQPIPDQSKLPTAKPSAAKQARPKAAKPTAKAAPKTTTATPAKPKAAAAKRPKPKTATKAAPAAPENDNPPQNPGGAPSAP